MEHADQPAGGLAKSRVGDRLREAREAQGLSLEEVATHTRVNKRLLEAIENADYDQLPAATYSAGFVKVYAQLVGLNGPELSRQFREEIARTGERRLSPQPFEPADPARVPSRLLAFVALAVAVLIGIGFAVWRGGSLWGYGADQRARLAAGTEVEAGMPPPTAPDAPPSAAGAALAPAAPPPAASPVGRQVALIATDNVWFKVYERGGKTLFMGEVPAGQRYEVPADAVDPLLRTGRPEALQVTVGGQPIPPLGAPSKLVSGVSLAPDALLARGAAAPAAATPAPAALAPTTVPSPAPAPAPDGAAAAPLAPANEGPTP